MGKYIFPQGVENSCFMNTRARQPKTRNLLLFRLGSIATGLVIAILLGEFIVRILFPVRFSYMATYPDGFFIHSDGCGYHQAMNFPPVERTHKDGIHTNLFMTNSFGMHDPEPSSLPTSNTIRILAVGCSQTEGVGISDLSKTWPRQLEKELNINADHERAFEVLNGGVIGHNTWQQSAHAAEMTPRFNPDLWLMAYYGQDLIGMWGRNIFGVSGQYRLKWHCLWDADYIEFFLGNRGPPGRWLIDHSILWRWLMFSFTDFDLQSEIVERLYRDHTLANLDAIDDFIRNARQYGVKPVFVFLPGLAELEDLKGNPAKEDWIRSGVGKICRDLNVDFIDMTDDMLDSLKTEYPNRTAHEAWSVSELDQPHYNADANRFFARHLSRHLSGLLKDPSVNGTDSSNQVPDPG
jgi:hypothetical protein